MFHKNVPRFTLKSTDGASGDPGYLVQSGSYLPISVGLWGQVKEAHMNWGDTVQLESVHAYQGGVELVAADFTILSQNNEPNFASFAHGTAPVPEPETYALMLAGLGLVGWAARRRKA
ncbi:MAG: FxDxF family PEP-CTERM protein [Rhodocyclaceae bacterium]|nr:FxDxF family PEP-CTERM protein [Rhodocyclaceae bacterium]